MAISTFKLAKGTTYNFISSEDKHKLIEDNTRFCVSNVRIVDTRQGPKFYISIQYLRYGVVERCILTYDNKGDNARNDTLRQMMRHIEDTGETIHNVYIKEVKISKGSFAGKYFQSIEVDEDTALNCVCES